MRTTLLKIIVCNLCLTLGAHADDAVATTFTYADPTAKSVEVAGEFSNWKTLPLTKDDAGNWTKTLHLKPGTYGYKLVVDGEWKFDPKNPARKTVNDIENSMITVGGAAVAAGTQFSFTDAKAQTVHLAGEFNRWLDNVEGRVTGKAEWQMQNDGAGNWTFTKDLPPGRYQFKYVIDGGARWEKDPTKPTEGDNSVIEVRAGAAAPAAGNVAFVFAAPAAKAVSVAGEFNQWNATANPLQKDATGMWTTKLNLKPGKYQYKFVVDGEWLLDPAAAETATDAAGNQNSVKIVAP
ncbi:MAG: 1,4-alpha-glucan branching enzyme GlgB [Verrucomicrobiae bacterium]|nr:1,4-alpha-glucan branching enzyme GlgB [Verrucomicrobiae bacterium]